MPEVFESFVISENPDDVKINREVFPSFEVPLDPDNLAQAPCEPQQPIKRWGDHYICDLKDCDKTKVADIEAIKAFSSELMQVIDMQPLGEAKYENLLGDDAVSKGIDGYSFVQFIQTSSLCMHFVNSTGEVFCDLFSCKEFKADLVRDLLVKHFSGVVKYENNLVR